MRITPSERWISLNNGGEESADSAEECMVTSAARRELARLKQTRPGSATTAFP